MQPDTNIVLARLGTFLIDRASWAESCSTQVLARFAECFTDFLDLENSAASVAIATMSGHDKTPFVS